MHCNTAYNEMNYKLISAIDVCESVSAVLAISTNVWT